MKTNLLTLALILTGVVFLVLHANLVEWTPLKIVGAALALLSVVMLAVARLQLGAAFSLQARAKTLVTTGLYARIRNPIYVFGWLFILGMATVLENWILLAIAVLLIPLQLYRARKEEAVLSAAFGEQYARYKASTWF